MNELIRKYLHGKAEFADLQQLLSWLQQKEHRSEWKDIKSEWMNERLTDEMNDQETIAWLKIKKSINLTSNASMQRKRILFYKMVAVFLALISISIFLFKSQDPRLLTSTILTDKAQISRLILPDSTVIWLNSGSRLSYDNAYGVKNRNLRLYGEAFFQVKKNKKLPFHVLAGNHDVKVTGTSFMVTNYDRFSTLEVILEEGSVQIVNQANRTQSRLIPNQKYSYNKATGLASIQKVIPQNLTSWRYGTINFYQSTLEDIATKLELKYNQPFVLSKSIKNTHFTFTIVDEKLPDVLSILEEISTIKATQVNDTIYLN